MIVGVVTVNDLHNARNFHGDPNDETEGIRAIMELYSLSPAISTKPGELLDLRNSLLSNKDYRPRNIQATR